MALECSAPLPVALMVNSIYPQWFMEGKFLSTSKQPYVLIYILTWKKGKQWKEQKLGLNVREHHTSPPHEGFSSSKDKKGWPVGWHSHDLSNSSTQQTRGITVWSYNSSLNHRKGFSPGICLIGGITLHLIRCVRKEKLAKIISQLFCSLRRKNSSFKCVTVLLRMHMKTYTKWPAWGFWRFSVLIFPLRYFSVGAERNKDKL